jgi:hypothetical protein
MEDRMREAQVKVDAQKAEKQPVSPNKKRSDPAIE